MKTYLKLIITMLILILNAVTLHCAFDDYGWGVKPLGMGSAYTAVSGDANTMLFNPAGASGINNIETAISSARLYTGLDGIDIAQNYFGFAANLKKNRGYTGVVWYSLSTPGLYREDTVSLTYSRPIENEFLKSNNLSISMGANAKYLFHIYELDKRTVSDPVFENGRGKGNISLDAGMIVNIQECGVSIGLASRNVNQPDVGLKTEDNVLAENAMGVKYTGDLFGIVIGKAAKIFYTPQKITITADLVEKKGKLTGRTGFEAVFYENKCAFRLGYQPQIFTVGLGYNISLGRSAVLSLDYAFGVPIEIKESLGNHRLGVTLRFN